MKIMGTPKSMDIVILIGLALLWTNALLQDIAFSLKGMLSLRTMASLTCELIWVKIFVRFNQ